MSLERADIAIVTGGRDYDLTDADNVWLCRMWERFGFRILLHGDCPTGVDRQAAAWARSLGLCDAACPAQWDAWRRRGNAAKAGPDRNYRMALACAHPVIAVCLAFPGGRGTADMTRQAKLHGIDVLEAPSVTQGSNR